MRRVPVGPMPKVVPVLLSALPMPRIAPVLPLAHPMPRLAPILLPALVALLTALAPPLHAQSLEDVERLTRLGRTEEARSALSGWWEGDRASASRRDLQRALWLRGRLTVDPVQAGLDFQRLVVLYPSGPFTADAVFRLAQGAWAMGDEEGARRYVDTLRRDYPGSDAYVQARGWLADAGPLPPPGDTPSSTARAGGGAAAEGRPAAERPSERGGRPDEAAGGAPLNYSVQLGAFAETERATALYDSVRADGVEARIVRVQGSQFTHVRVGRFAQRAEAVELLEELTAMGINAALVRDDRAEQVIQPR